MYFRNLVAEFEKRRVEGERERRREGGGGGAVRLVGGEEEGKGEELGVLGGRRGVGRGRAHSGE